MHERTDHRAPAPDRYREAVLARRAELRDQHRLLVGGHRGDLRGTLALSRLAGAAAADTALAGLARAAREHIDAGRPARERLPDLVSSALARIAAELNADWAGELGRGLHRIAAERGVAMPAGWPRLPAPARPPVVGPPGPRPRHRLGTLLAGAPAGVAAWRLALLPPVLLPLLGVPAAGVPALGGPALLAAVLAAALLAVAMAVAGRRTATERARWRTHVDAVLAAARIALHTDLARRTLQLERTAVADLDAAVGRRRAEVEAELRRLAPDRPAAVPGG